MEDVLIVKHKCRLKYHNVIVQKGKLMFSRGYKLEGGGLLLG